MGVEFGVWRIDSAVQRVAFEPMADEARLERILMEDPDVLGLDILIVGQQISTATGKRIDLLGIDRDGQLYVIELKRDKTPRDVVAQVLDYGAWARSLGYEEIAALFGSHNDGAFESAFEDRFGASPPEALNETHQLVIVASALDPGTERIMSYLSDSYQVPINAVFFRYMQDGDREYLVRSWLTDPDEVEDRPARRAKERWNKRDYYISFGQGEHRDWEDARKYGFVSGGGAKWYIQTLYSLDPGMRVFVHVPQVGYVGVGVVVNSAVPVDQFTVDISGVTRQLLDMPLNAPKMGEFVGNPDAVETLARVDWLREIPLAEAIWEKGFFANQNTACKLRNEFTLSRLIDRFGLDD